MGEAMDNVMEIRRGVESDAEELSAAAERWFRETFSPDNTAEDMAIYCAGAVVLFPHAQPQRLRGPRSRSVIDGGHQTRREAAAVVRGVYIEAH